MQNKMRQFCWSRFLGRTIAGFMLSLDGHEGFVMIALVNSMPCFEPFCSVGEKDLGLRVERSCPEPLGLDSAEQYPIVDARCYLEWSKHLTITGSDSLQTRRCGNLRVLLSRPSLQGIKLIVNGAKDLAAENIHHPVCRIPVPCRL